MAASIPKFILAYEFKVCGEKKSCGFPDEVEEPLI